MAHSAFMTAANEHHIEIIVRLDNDDPTKDQYPKMEGVKYIYGDRDVLSKYWNECYAVSKGEILMHAGDDIVFKTPDWDLKVIEEFEKWPDRLVFVHGDDGYWGHNFGTHGFLHRNWVDVVGYFVPPFFSSDYNDTWLNDVANTIHRRKYVEIMTEHMHPNFGKGPLDLTHQERLARHNADNVDLLYSDKRPERDADAEKLQWAIQTFSQS